ncbi:nudC domain-containing protein 2-like [Babylonia areolata]|uniref:nudC domain-containing protein 2-like n=1 Tax=Babylonia areolata TaxID=304850 RepID=UPI003FCF34E8
MAHFDEKSGIVACKTEWGKWWQTLEEVYVEVNTGKPITAKLVKCDIKPRLLKVVVSGEVLINGGLSEAVHPDDSTWTIEDRQVLRVCLSKSLTTADHCWKSLLTDAYVTDPHTFDEMQKKLTLQRFQFENPGFDFSGATMTGNYQGGGPQFS